MEQKIKEIAQRIKGLREILEISVEEMAECTGVTVEEYMLYESGAADYSFTFIFKCAQRFNVDVTDILKGSSPTLNTYSIVRKGEGLPIARRKGFSYQNLAPLFKDRIAEPFFVTAPFNADDENKPIMLSHHEGQEINIVVKGSLKLVVDGHTEILNEGDTAYYSSTCPHGMVAANGADCEFISIVLSDSSAENEYTESNEYFEAATRPADTDGCVSDKFVTITKDQNGIVNGIEFKNEENFNFAFDIVDALAEKCPNKTAMIHLDKVKNEHIFTFEDIAKNVNKTANYFESLGIRRGDTVMLVLKRHYQFWFSILALHKIGAIVIPATNLLQKHDFEYRFKSASIKAIICTADGDTAHQAEMAAESCDELEVMVIANGKRENWHCFDEEYLNFSDVYDRKADSPCGSDKMLMFFTSGTTGNPKIATHNYKYVLGHYLTANQWHNINPDGVHLTISDTGWGKALWGKLYGQWMCEGAVFVYDFDKFSAEDILPLFKQYNITTFCAPPTMYRFFIKEDLSKYDLSSLEYATIAGEALNPEVFQQFYNHTGIKLMEGFGQTETTLAIANFVGMEPKPGSMGKPSPLYDVDVILPDGTSAAVGETGEIVIRTDKKVPCGLFCGYYRDEEKTRETWHDGVFHTGDTAWRDEDGYFWYVGRVDDLIKSSGYRIGPFEIESIIMELPYVLECAVTGAPDPIRGQVVKANIVLVSGKEPSEELKKEIQTYVKAHTAPYKYPRIVEFFDSLPKTVGSGKIKRADIRKADN